VSAGFAKVHFDERGAGGDRKKGQEQNEDDVLGI
jgi:hypothetical protein